MKLCQQFYETDRKGGFTKRDLFMIVDQIFAQFNELFNAPTLIPENIPKYTEDEIRELCQSSVDTLNDQSTILKIDVPVVIVGDIHGSLDDLMRLIKMFGKPPERNYLFLGDYVDRGDYSLPVIEYLLASVCKYPNHVWMIRGNHEFSHINRVYGFYDEIIANGDNEIIWEYFQEVFYYLPLAAIVFDKIFCVHGGLSPRLLDLSELRALSRPLPNYINLPLVSDLVWSDPTDECPEYAANQRGSGVLFGTNAVTKFLEENQMSLIVRGHQCTANGVHAFANSMGVTVFSCSDYSGIEKNKCGAFEVESLSDISIYSLAKAPVGFTKEVIHMQIKQSEPGLELFKKKKTIKTPNKVRISTQPNSPVKKETDVSNPVTNHAVVPNIPKKITTTKHTPNASNSGHANSTRTINQNPLNPKLVSLSYIGNSHNISIPIHYKATIVNKPQSRTPEQHLPMKKDFSSPNLSEHESFKMSAGGIPTIKNVTRKSTSVERIPKRSGSQTRAPRYPTK